MPRRLRPDIPYEVNATTFVQKPLFRTLRVIPHSDCFTTPAAGNRNTSSGVLAFAGTNGYAWSSSPAFSGSVYAGMFNFHSGEVDPLNTGAYRGHARTVRCVQHLSKLLLVPIRTAPKQPGWAAFPALNLQSTEPPPTQ